ncbi:rhomboid family intramembrane serine protease [Salinimicrobium marinum]|uniref:Rhomboid family intramembrane serine protease n=1 Tax=Salinimicrobium marinum TaxID=680283 RepID=A0A918SHK9_9FLAO|nr:rhomboid family intramembrane serine protease [Salinimicrobium marinum]GHA44211.1 rhomboid family intramembrane serine protease [Salinimicrobium marinum]
MRMSNSLRYKLNTATVSEKLIAVNVAVFLLFFLFRTLAFLFQFPGDFLLEWFVFPKELGEFLLKPWSIITYAFLHSGIWHILSNMLILYFSGIYFLNYFSGKKLLNFYFLGAIFGALVYMLSYNLFPAFSGLGRSYLLGASAAVMSVLVGIATHIPHMKIRLLLIGSIKFWWIAAFLVVLDIIQIPISNPGGHLAHLGGAAFGYVYARQLGKGNDFASGFEKILNWFGSLFNFSSSSSTTSGRSRRSNLKTVHRKKNTSAGTSYTSTRRNKKEEQEKIDAILDKISKSGYDSLSKQEKDYLFNAGKDN